MKEFAIAVLLWIALAGDMGVRRCSPEDVACVEPPRPARMELQR